MNDREASFDLILPPAIAQKAVEAGVKKAHTDGLSLILLAILAGAFISLGGMFFTVVTAGGSALPYGVTRLLGGVVFCLGLILVILAGAELFTGNNLMVMAWASGRISTRLLLRNWGIVYLGNLIGALATAILAYFAGYYQMGGGIVGQQVLTIAINKCAIPFGQGVALGILCNALVCLAVWLTMSARTTTDKIVAILFPISGFVAMGFEHSIANMFFIPMGWLLYRFDSEWVQAHVSALDFTHLTLSGFLNNLVAVTLGNIIGGTLLVAMIYWFIYQRPKEQA
ncbi:MAG UNVERIFIED_CONTAM: formate/nitrite transporter family protein [Anaerolineae bacterium]|jgi:formate/nitrite transporter